MFEVTFIPIAPLEGTLSVPIVSLTCFISVPDVSLMGAMSAHADPLKENILLADTISGNHNLSELPPSFWHNLFASNCNTTSCPNSSIIMFLLKLEVVICLMMT